MARGLFDAESIIWPVAYNYFVLESGVKKAKEGEKIKREDRSGEDKLDENAVVESGLK